MRSNFHLTPLAACLALTLLHQLTQQSRFLCKKLLFKPYNNNSTTSSRCSTCTTISPDSLQFIQQRTDRNHVTHIRMQQKYAGFMVYGGYAIMHSLNSANHLLAANSKVEMNGTVYRGLQSELGQPEDNFVSNGELALKQFKANYEGKELREEQVIPIVYIDNKHQAHWAYKVSVYVRHKDKIPERPTAILDAKSFKPFVQWNDIKTASRQAVKGMGYGGNHKTGEYLYGKTYPLLDLTRDEKRSTCSMANNDVKVVDMNHDYFSFNRPMKFECKKDQNADSLIFWTGYKADGYDKENGAFSPTNDALYAGYVIKHLYHDWYDVEVLSKNGKPMQLVMRVHYGDGFENAYWDGKRMTFGDGGDILYPLVSLSIGAHEISHGFTEQHSDLQYFAHSGGINESFSDMASQAAAYYSTGASTGNRC